MTRETDRNRDTYRLSESTKWLFSTRDILIVVGASASALVAATLWCKSVNDTLVLQGAQIAMIQLDIREIKVALQRIENRNSRTALLASP